MRVLDLFSGIGGFSLGLERAGFETVAFCEIEPYCRAILAKHWPGVKIYEDIRTLTADVLERDGIAVDAICGGFPCQDLSHAGKRAGLEGERSGLWGEYRRLIGELRPRVVIVENVPGLLSLGMGTVLGDLAALRYDAVWECIPASAVSAPHQRDRIWIVAHAISPVVERTDARSHSGALCTEKRRLTAVPDGEDVSNTLGQRQQGQGVLVHPVRQKARGNGKAVDAVYGRIGDQWAFEPDVGRVANGVPNRSHRLKALGNAVVPQVVELIGRAIMEVSREQDSR